VGRIPIDFAVVTREAFAQLVQPRRARGRLRALRFDAGGDGPRDNARRALAEGFGSVAPNTIVVGIDRDRNHILVHQLDPGAGDPKRAIDPLDLR
jgi:hypothetical protein